MSEDGLIGQQLLVERQELSRDIAVRIERFERETGMRVTTVNVCFKEQTADGGDLSKPETIRDIYIELNL